MVNFSDLPEEILDIIIKRLQHVDDFVTFGSVCKLLQSIATSRKQQMRPFAPLLMLRVKDDVGDDDEQLGHGVFNISRQRVFNLRIQHHTQGRKCWGSPFGWLVTYGLDLSIQLFNPFTQVQLSLPSQPNFSDQYEGTPEKLVHSFVHKIMLFPSSSRSGLLVMAIYGNISKLAFARPGDAAWTSLENTCVCNHLDVLLFKGQFYSTTYGGHLMLCEIDTPEPKVTEFAPPPDILRPTSWFYLVEMSGDLHLVERVLNELKEDGHFHYSTYLFDVYKFDFVTRSWIELSDLGDYALFLGNTTSFALSTLEYPDFKSNAIYFTDDNSHRYVNRFRDIGIYDYEEEEVEPISWGDDDVLSRFSLPLFIMPSL